MTDIYVMSSDSTLPERIKQRLEALGKNPSSVAIEAGLGRSALRDILIGKAENPRIDTLRKLTIPLKCSLEFLTGESREVGSPSQTYPGHQYHLDPREETMVKHIEAGAYRADPMGYFGSLHWTADGEMEPDHRYLVYNEPRLPGWTTELYQIRDLSLLDIGIRPLDLLTVASPPDGEKVPLRSGTIVLASHRINSGSLTEISARVVRILKSKIRLECRPSEGTIDPIEIEFKQQDDFSKTYEPYENTLPNWYVTNAGSVTIEGLIVRMTRDFPVD